MKDTLKAWKPPWPGRGGVRAINPCRLQYVYQGMDPKADAGCIDLPWRMGPLTQTNSSC
ncbi:hypothetical protein OTB20_31790 [Streptomyces sp. H27-H1]|uniref:hypothetical protein n=1 Tax=Streptomyces sp. H27-H1 TaxID=2996461 RepID=UPI0022710017|nr:hypothetical protein [Streptomyces sp. H27-H1]MCY0930695.1 hypothetical protein [Streptomyces sp. H27-H1]